MAIPLTLGQRGIVLHRLRSGLGVEDIAVMDGLPLAEVRAYVRGLGPAMQAAIVQAGLAAPGAA